VLISSTIRFCNFLGFSKKNLFHFLSFCKDASISTPFNSSYFYEHLLSFHLFFFFYLVLILYLFDVCRFFFVHLWNIFFLHLFYLSLVLMHHGICCITNVLASFIMAIICNYLCLTFFPSPPLAFSHLFQVFSLVLKKIIVSSYASVFLLWFCFIIFFNVGFFVFIIFNHIFTQCNVISFFFFFSFCILLLLLILQCL
jgi:hypothetical protein